MAMKALDLHQIAEMDGGKYGLLFKREMARLAKDMSDRPALKTKRKVTLTIEMTPRVDGDQAYGAEFALAVKTNLPEQKGGINVATFDRDGRLLFNDMSLDNPNQRTMDELEESDA